MRNLRPNIRRYAKAIVKKFFVAAFLILLILVKPVFWVIQLVSRVLAVPVAILSTINSGILFFNADPGGALLSLCLAAASVVLFFILPMAMNALNGAIAHLKYLVRRPLVYKSRLTYTFG